MSLLLADQRKRTLLLHTCCWLIYIFFEVSIVYSSQQRFAPLRNYVFYYAINIVLFYTHLLVLDITFDHLKPAYFKGIMLFFAQFLVYLFAKSLLDILFSTETQAFSAKIASVKKLLFLNIYRGITFCTLATFYWVAGNIANYKRRALDSEKKQLTALKEKAEMAARLSEARNAYLHQQMNPHLLFNALNFIYSSVYPYSADGSRCVLLLSDIMRYSLESTGADGKKSLVEEMEQVHNLIAINRYRFDQQLCLETHFRGAFDRYRIIPLLLLTLTENLFKHGNLLDPAYPAILNLDVSEEGLLTYSSHNRKKADRKHRQNNGLGLQNTRIRLNNSYSGSHQLTITEDDTIFELKLALQL
jgi:two-component system LytT family sensor kinase